MWASKGYGGKKEQDHGLVAVAIDKDKGSQYAIRWAIDHLLSRGRAIVLIHVTSGSSFAAASSAIVSASGPGSSPNYQQVDKQTKELFLTFRCFCTRKDIRCIDVTLKDNDVGRALIEYANYAAIENLVLGASKGGFMRKFKQADVPTIVSRGAPDFCNIFVISKTKMSNVRNASRPVPHTSPLQNYLESVVKDKSSPSTPVSTPPKRSLSIKGERPSYSGCTPPRDDRELVRPDRIHERLMMSDFPESDTDISFVSSDRTSVDRLSVHYDYMDSARTPRMSTSSDHSFGSVRFGQRMNDMSPRPDFSFMSQESGMTSSSSLPSEETETEMRRLKLELKQTMEMYSEACKEAVVAKERERQQAMELHRWRLEEDKKLEETGTPEEVAMVLAERKKAERAAEQQEERKLSTGNTDYRSTNGSVSYRKYTIEEIETATDSFSESLKVGEGGYGPVFKCYLDHTRVAVKVLRPDAAQGRTQFQQEVEVLSCIRHPNMVLLLGACPEYGCIVYEYMANGSLDDRLFRRGNTPALSWQVRFRIAADIATGLNFLHQTKPEPLVHRDLKPGNILLDRYFVAKIGDVGLARLVPPSVADHITQYCMTSAAGTFCYIDPEYQQTGMLGVKSDVYSLGIVLLQLLTAKPPMGLAHHAEHFIEKGTFANMLDPTVPDWPVEEAIVLAKIAIQCAELRRKDRPDLGKVVLPTLDRLRDFADERSHPFMFFTTPDRSPVHSQTSMSQISDAAVSAPNSSKGPSPTASPRGRVSKFILFTSFIPTSLLFALCGVVLLQPTAFFSLQQMQMR
ncbi:U-box domain-containing protein 52 [Beta vulgaris subsp. vulgaris]|uniref:U-box domain-containing protein 52 n=1 Tax=Beta vulgaris subsp. vulgaris TaxID=3555 RepID=UPI0025490F83|nr:U-box domain-containing protein 52 [Beta vulgaris subsp. vulgaris]